MREILTLTALYDLAVKIITTVIRKALEGRALTRYRQERILVTRRLICGTKPHVATKTRARFFADVPVAQTKFIRKELNSWRGFQAILSAYKPRQC